MIMHCHIYALKIPVPHMDTFQTTCVIINAYHKYFSSLRQLFYMLDCVHVRNDMRTLWKHVNVP